MKVWTRENKAQIKVKTDRNNYLPYGRQIIDTADCLAVDETLTSDWLTTGPKVDEFEKAWAGFCGAGDAVVVSNGTAALHTAVIALDLKPGDKAIVTPMTFVASVNCLLYAGVEPLFADVDPGTLLMNPESIAALYHTHGKAVRAIIPVDYAGQPCDYDAIRTAAPGVPVIADACHSPGAEDKRRLVGSGALAELTCFSFHPVKHLTTGEGGAITTNDPEFARRMRVFRNHGIDTDHRQRAAAGSWAYDMSSLGFNYRLTDIQCALGLSQMTKLPAWLARRRELAGIYADRLADVKGIEPLAIRFGISHAWHLYVVRVKSEFALPRDAVFQKLRENGIGANVHYGPVHLHSYYRERFGCAPGLCPAAEAAAQEILSLPMWAGMEEGDVERVAEELQSI
jgi:perosamine synthetase